MKAGYKTSEFWLVVVAAILPLLNQAFGWDIDVTFVSDGLIGIASLVAYVLGRSWIKTK